MASFPIIHFLPENIGYMIGAVAFVILNGLGAILWWILFKKIEKSFIIIEERGVCRNEWKKKYYLQYRFPEISDEMINENGEVVIDEFYQKYDTSKLILMMKEKKYSKRRIIKKN